MSVKVVSTSVERHLEPAATVSPGGREGMWRGAAAQVLRALDEGLLPHALAGLDGARSGGPKVIRNLEIQLHPASLGTVSARLTITGGNMEITISVPDRRLAEGMVALMPMTEEVRAMTGCRIRTLLAVLLVATACSISEAAAKPERQPGVCERQMAAAARRHGVPLGFLYAIGLTETGRRKSREAALEAFRKARAEGKTLIDLGCMQINHHYHGRNFRSPAEMLDPARNVDYGPKNESAQKRYVCIVIRNLVASGFGRWTPRARAFCGK